MLLNAYGRLLPRRRVIEVGLVGLGVLLSLMAGSGRISAFLANAQATTGLPDLSLLTSLLSIVVGVAFFAGISYAFVAIPAQTQLQEDLPEDVRGRVFGVLNMLVSVASFLPILIVGPIADIVGTTFVLLLVAAAIGLSGVASIVVRGPLKPAETAIRVTVGRRDPIAAALGAELPDRDDADDEDDDGESGDEEPKSESEIGGPPTAATSGSFATPAASADPALRGEAPAPDDPGDR